MTSTISKLRSPLQKMCKIFIKKKIKWSPSASAIANDFNILHSLNKDLYEAVQNEGPNGYFYSQSYWDYDDSSLLFTDSYWTDKDGWEHWLNSKQRNDILDKYRDYFQVDTSYNVLLEKKRYEIPLL